MAPIKQNEHDLWMGTAGKTKMESVGRAQLRVIYTVLSIFRLALSEISQLTKKDLILAIQTGKLSVSNKSTNILKTYTLPENGKKLLEELVPEIELIFDLNGFQFLGDSRTFSENTFNKGNFIRFINYDMKNISEKHQI